MALLGLSLLACAPWTPAYRGPSRPNSQVARIGIKSGTIVRFDDREVFSDHLLVLPGPHAVSVRLGTATATSWRWGGRVRLCFVAQPGVTYVVVPADGGGRQASVVNDDNGRLISSRETPPGESCEEALGLNPSAGPPVATASGPADGASESRTPLVP